MTAVERARAEYIDAAEFLSDLQQRPRTWSTATYAGWALNEESLTVDALSIALDMAEAERLAGRSPSWAARTEVAF